MVKAKMIQKLGITVSGDKILEIIQAGFEEGIPYVKLNSGQIFYHKFKSPLPEIYSRYVYSHYEIDKPAHMKYGVHRNHTDNLLNLKVDDKTRKFLLEKMPVREGDTVLELGAFYGFGTLKLSELAGEKGKVIAVEADPTNFEILKKNISANKVRNVEIINRGIWSEKCQLPFYKDINQRKSFVTEILKNKNTTEIIQAESVDNILNEVGIEKADFITMEINAAEVEALLGMNKTLSKNGIRVVAAGWYEYQEKAEWIKIKEILEKYGFKVFIGLQNRVFALKE